MQNKIKIIRSIFSARIHNQPYKFNFAITSACNALCKTCNIGRIFRENPRIVEDDLSVDEIDKIFRSLPASITWLSLSGGEPFLREDLVDICQKATKRISSLSLISIPTNGLLEKDVIQKTKSILRLPIKNLFLNFSLDGPPDIHNYLRGVPNAFSKTWETYQKILALSQQDSRLHVNIETTISRYNIDLLGDFFKKLTAQKHKITVTIAHTGFLYKNTHSKKNFVNLGKDKRELRKIIKIVEKSLSFYSPNDLIERIYLNKILEFYKNPKQQPCPCVALKSSLAMDPKGNITPCFMWGKTLGNLREYNYNFRDFIKDNRREIARVKKIIQEQHCPNCWTPCEAYQSIINELANGHFRGLI